MHFAAIGAALLRQIAMAVTLILTLCRHRGVEFQLAAFGTKVEIHLQRAGDQVRQGAEKQPGFPHLQFFSAHIFHSLIAAQTY